MRHVMIVGATDGIGLALARHYLDGGWRVGLVGRDPEKLDRVVEELREGARPGRVAGEVCDVTDHDAVGPAFESLLASLGQLDLMIYCAGVLPPAEGGGEQRFRAARSMFEVNTVGAVHFLELGADYMAELGKGTLAALGSVAGERGRGGNPAYNASKAGLHAYLGGLRHRLHGTGVTVCTVKPGFVKTKMLGEDPPPVAIEAEDAAARIADGLRKGREVFFVPRWWWLVGVALRLMPRWLFKRIGPK